ncbi:hypothetical protein T265_13004, partial [Opisthorchis viverrini]
MNSLTAIVQNILGESRRPVKLGLITIIPLFKEDVLSGGEMAQYQTSVSDLFASLDQNQPPKFDYPNDTQSFGSYATRARVRRQHSLQVSHQKEHISAMVSRLPDFSSYERHELVVDAGSNKENSHPHSMALRFKQLSIGNSSSHLDVESAHRSEDVRAKTNIFCSTPGPDCQFGNSPTAIRRRRVVRIASLENLPATPIPFQEQISPVASPPKGANRSLTTQTPLSSATGWFEPQAAKDVKGEPTEKEVALAVRPSVILSKGGKKSDAFLKRLTRHFRIDNMILNQSYWRLFSGSKWLKWLEREFTDRKVRGSNPTSATRLPLSRLGRPGSIPALRLFSGSKWLKWLERGFTDRKVRGSNPTSATRLPLSRLGRPGSIPALVPPSCGMAHRNRRKQTIRKLGEGCFGEVFQCTANYVAPVDLHSTTESLVAIKVIPIEGSVRFNGDCQKTFNEVVSEFVLFEHLWGDEIAQWLEGENSDLKVRGSRPNYASRPLLCRLGQPNTIPAFVLPSGGL